MRIALATVGILVALYTSSVRADDYRDATDAAYCIGVLQANIDIWKGWSPDVQSKIAATMRYAEQKKFRKEAFVEGAIKQAKLDGATASKMTSVGLADANLYVQSVRDCYHSDLAGEQRANCLKRTEPLHDRIENCEMRE